MYEHQTEQAIKQRMLDGVSNDVDKQEGSFVNDVIAPVAIELGAGYQELDQTLDIIFAETSYGEYLTKRASEFGVDRKLGTKAMGLVKFTGNEGTFVPKGTLLKTAGGLLYSTMGDLTLLAGTTETITVEAEGIGTFHNVPANIINFLPIKVAGVTAVTNPNPLTTGTNPETDMDLLKRLLLKVRNPSTSGNVTHYQNWALEVAGIGDAKVFPLWNGPGTIKIVVIDTEEKPVSDELRHQTIAYIESMRPIGVDLTVLSAHPRTIEITAVITCDANYTVADVTNSFKNKLEEYRKQIAFKKSYVSYAVIGSLLLDSEGIVDYSELKVNSDIQNILIATEEVPVFGSVTLHG
jgi:uncharacterized phage protein gp47/JayE